jgi:two-component system OmpR family response regulator
MERMRRVLVVEDDAEIRSMVVEALTDEGYEALGAAEGEEGLRLLTEWLPDLVVLDLMMRGLDGMGFRARQRDLPNGDVPVMLVSATRRDDLPQAAADLEASGYLAKPFALDDFLSMVDRLARRDGA